MAVNKCIFLGNLVKDPVLKILPTQTALVVFTLAINHRWRDKSGEKHEEVCFIECQAYGQLAQEIAAVAQKGKPLLVDGRLKQDSWTDKESGQKRYKHKLVVEFFEQIHEAEPPHAQA